LRRGRFGGTALLQHRGPSYDAFASPQFLPGDRARVSSLLTELLVIAILLILNGIFSMSELAIVTAKRVRLERQAEAGSAGARAALALAGDPDEFLSTVQVGITLVGVVASVYGGATLAEYLATRLAQIAWLAPHAHAASLTVVIAAITYLSVIIGELVPKRIALGNPERVAAIVARPMQIVSRVGSPLVHLLSGSTQLILRLFGVKGLPEPGLTEEEIHAVVEQGAESGVVPAVEHEIVENVFRLGDQQVSAVMTVRPDVEWIDVSATPEDIRAAVADGRRHWLLVCDDDIENVRGIVRVGALLAACLDGKPLSLEGAMEEALFVPATTPTFKLLETFRQSPTQVAVVLDEYGGVEGVVSVSDILAHLAGAATPHRPSDRQTLTRNADGSWTAAGDVAIDRVAEALDVADLDVAERRGYRTLAGLIMSRLGYVPRVGEVMTIPGFTFRVEALDGRRIERVRIERSGEAPVNGDPGHSTGGPGSKPAVIRPAGSEEDPPGSPAAPGRHTP
jgi:putative hemolysin